MINLPHCVIDKPRYSSLLKICILDGLIRSDFVWPDIARGLGMSIVARAVQSTAKAQSKGQLGLFQGETGKID